MKLIPIIILLLVLTPALANAKSYQIFLFYDKNVDEIRLDRFVSEPVKLVDTEDIISFDERADLQVANNFQVNLEAYQYTFPQTLVYPYTEGAFVINVDYFPHVKAINIKSQNGKVLNIDVSRTSTCNQNFVCEYEKGEDTNTCIHDCIPQDIGESVTFSEETLRTLQAQNGVIRNEEGVVLLSTNDNSNTIETPSTLEDNNSNSSNILLLIGGILFLVAGVGVFFWKLKKR
jgi:flagellar basal body-associated protein FliL